MVPPGLHPIATDRHGAPSRAVPLAAINEEQATLVVGAGTQSSGAALRKAVPGEDSSNCQRSFGGDAEVPCDFAIDDGRGQGRTPQDREQGVRRLFTTHDLLEGLSDPENVGQLVISAEAAHAGQPRSGTCPVGKLVRLDPVHHRRAVQNDEEDSFVGDVAVVGDVALRVLTPVFLLTG